MPERASMPKSGRALIADDHSLYRSGLALLLGDQLGFASVMEAGSFEQASEMLKEWPETELALYDLAMPGMTGAAALSPLRLAYPRMRIAIVAASEQRDDVLTAIGAGLSGFIPKTLPIEEFVAAIEFVRSGGIYVPGFMLDLDPRRTESGRKPAPAPAGLSEKRQSALTQRQKEVLDCVRAGLSNREIAEKLDISVGTVKVHVAALLTALDAKSRIQLTLRRA